MNNEELKKNKKLFTDVFNEYKNDDTKFIVYFESMKNIKTWLDKQEK